MISAGRNYVMTELNLGPGSRTRILPVEKVLSPGAQKGEGLRTGVSLALVVMSEGKRG